MSLSIILILVGLLIGRLGLAVDAGLRLVSTALSGLLLIAGWIILGFESHWAWLGIMSVAYLVHLLNRHVGIAIDSDYDYLSENDQLALLTSLSVAMVWLLDNFVYLLGDLQLLIVAAVFGMAGLSHLLLWVHLRRYSLTAAKLESLDDVAELPTVSLLIPARNESHALTDTLTKALQSTYPKLEILVLDDCSQDKTPDIIRSFAHDGARFLAGNPPPVEWLGRNYALEQLRLAANGELLVFADTDVKFEPGTISQLVGLMAKDNLDMVSFMPAQQHFSSLGWLLPPLTNFWLSLLPFRLLGGRAAIGRCSAIRAEAINQADGFAQEKDSIYPIYKLAKQLIRAGKRYKFFYGRQIGISISKRYSSTQAHLVRSLSPAVGNNLAAVSLISAAAAVVLSPYVYFLIAPTVINGLTALSISLLFVRVSVRADGLRAAALASLQFPLLVIHELGLLWLSVVRFRFTDLIWKERLVCLPLLQAEAELPSS